MFLAQSADVAPFESHFVNYRDNTWRKPSGCTTDARAGKTITVRLTPQRFQSIEFDLGLPTECALANAARFNTLFVGPLAATERALALMGDRFDAPVETATAGRPLSLQPTTAARTLIIPDIDRLSPFDQRLLQDWMEQGPSCPRIISTARGPLLTALVNGAFLADLYYRLNTVYIDLGGPRASAPVAVGST
jgi:hypothetical protein